MQFAQQSRSGIEALLSSYGTPDQVAAFKKDRLTDEELYEVARRVAFLTFGDRPRFTRLEPWDAPHLPTCDKKQRIIYRSTYVTGVPSDLEAPLREFQAAGRRAAASWGELATYFTEPQVDLRYHSAECPTCASVAGWNGRWSVLVSVNFLVRPLSREYALGSEAT